MTNLEKNTILLAIGNIMTKGLLFLMIPFFTSWLTPSDFGYFDIYSTYIALLIPFLTLATGEALFRFSVESDSLEKTNKYITDNFIIVIVNCFIACIALIIYSIETNWHYTFPFILLLLGQTFNSTLQAYLRAMKKLNIYSFCNAFSVAVIAILVTLFVKFFALGLYGILLGYGIGYVVGDACIMFITGYFKHLNFKLVSVNGMIKLFQYSYPLIPNSVSWWIINASDRFIINLFISSSATGIFAVAHKIPAVCSAVFGVFNVSWQQAASEIVDKGNKSDIQNYFQKIYNLVIKRLISICIIIMSSNFIFFNYIFDIRYREAHLYTPILITAIIFMLIAQFLGGIQISMKMSKENGITTMVGALLNIVLNLLFINLFGLFAAAFSTFISYFVICILRKRIVNRNVSITVDRANYIYFIIYSYFLVSSYFLNYTILGFINLLTAFMAFIFINKDYIMRIKSKLVSI